MSSFRGTVRLVVLTGLASGFITDVARASALPAQILYSTGAEPRELKSPTGAVVFEFEPVSFGYAAPESLVRLGTILVHRQEPGEGFNFDNAVVRIRLGVFNINGEPVGGAVPTVAFDNFLSANIDESGRVAGGLGILQEYHGDSILTAGGYNLVLKPVETAPLWNMGDDDPVVRVDILARFEAVAVPEPAALLTFAAAGGFLLHRRRSANADAAARGRSKSEPDCRNS